MMGLDLKFKKPDWKTELLIVSSAVSFDMLFCKAQLSSLHNNTWKSCIYIRRWNSHQTKEICEAQEEPSNLERPREREGWLWLLSFLLLQTSRPTLILTMKERSKQASGLKKSGMHSFASPSVVLPASLTNMRGLGQLKTLILLTFQCCWRWVSKLKKSNPIT
jgi:hypothetical protein